MAPSEKVTSVWNDDMPWDLGKQLLGAEAELVVLPLPPEQEQPNQPKEIEGAGSRDWS